MKIVNHFQIVFRRAPNIEVILQKMSEAVQNSIIKFVQKNIRYYTELNVGWFGGEPLEALDVVENLSKRLICFRQWIYNKQALASTQ